MKLVSLFLALAVILAACSSPQAGPVPTQPNSSDTGSSQAAALPTSAPVDADPASTQTPESAGLPSTGEGLARTDEQGAVVVEVTPLNLIDPGETIEFEIGMNTHSIDLSMDLAALATLTTDTGKTVQASLWDAPGGGHHVSGKLIFPALADGQPVLEGAKELTLAIKDLDAPERIFSWVLSQ